MNGFKLESVGKNLKDLKITLDDKAITVKMYVESEENFRITQVSTEDLPFSYKLDNAIKEAFLKIKLNTDEYYSKRKEDYLKSKESSKASSTISIDESGVVLRGGTITLN